MKRIVFALLATLISTGVFAQDVKSVFVKYNNAINAESAQKNIKTYTTKMSMAVMDQFIEGKQYVIVGQSARNEFDAQGIAIVQVFHNGAAWMTDPMSGSVVDLPVEQAEGLKNMTVFTKMDPNNIDPSAKYLGKQEKEGKTYEVVSLVEKGVESKQYFDTDGLLRITEAMVDGNLTTVYFDDYKTLEFGYKMPFKLTTITAVMGQEMTMEMIFSDVKINDTIDPSIFQKP